MISIHSKINIIVTTDDNGNHEYDTEWEGNTEFVGVTKQFLHSALPEVLTFLNGKKLIKLGKYTLNKVKYLGAGVYLYKRITA